MKKEVKKEAVNAVDIPETCSGKPKPAKPEGAGKGKWVCADGEWEWKEELGGV